MKTRTILLSALLTLGAFAAITGCKRDDNDYYFYGNVTFWNDNPTLSDIIVTVDGNYSDDIVTTAYPSYCDDSRFANFYLVEGYHSYTAQTRRGTRLTPGSFYVSRNCDFIEIPD